MLKQSYQYKDILLTLVLQYNKNMKAVSYRGNPTEWLEFTSNFYNRVHMKISFDENTRMQYLLSVLEGEAKGSVEAISHNGIFYAMTLKSLKRDFGNPVIVSHLKIQSVLDQPQIKPKGKIGLQHYHQQVKIINIWLLSIGYKTSIISYENLSKAVAGLPNYLRTQFFKATCHYDLTDGTINLFWFEVWLEKQVKDIFNPLAKIVSKQDAKSNKHQHIKGQLIKNPYKIHTNHLNKKK